VEALAADSVEGEGSPDTVGREEVCRVILAFLEVGADRRCRILEVAATSPELRRRIESCVRDGEISVEEDEMRIWTVSQPSNSIWAESK